MAGKALDDVLLIGPDHDQVTHAGNDLTRILDRFAPPQLGIPRIEVNRRPSQLVHAGLEGEAGAGTGLFENHHQGTVGKRPVLLVGLELFLDPARTFKQVVEFGAGKILELQKMLDSHGFRTQAARKSLISGASRSTSSPASASLKTSGGNRRTTLSAVTLMSSPAASALPTSSPQGRSSSMPIISP